LQAVKVYIMPISNDNDQSLDVELKAWSTSLTSHKQQIRAIHRTPAYSKTPQTWSAALACDATWAALFDAHRLYMWTHWNWSMLRWS